MAIFTAVYDANILYSAPLRDFFVQLAASKIVDARWTEEIHSEWTRNVILNRSDIAPEQLARTKNLMNENVENCLVQGYEPIIPELELPDPGDRHVLAAAIHSRADFIVTFNLRDFPADNLAQYNIQPLHPDEFIMRLLNLNWQGVCKAAEKQRIRLKNPPKTPDEYLATLIELGLPLSAARMRELCYAD
ncbi:MAG: PIN domain-containing protein [Microcoleus sp. PH2017_10_PVI_O_A]|uniref:PIN domain-containing protein n=1 Tax=unclassified Microcoleus TaxID=2642155 RepID=UPI001E14EF03|nr:MULTISPECIES: PIN domain-containing protein [unclassified Microcoleus]MCC3406329.1 PIN domain-containing protein [Microcoleus sp. PH2017_10_PVI_O_A]MCC3460313.1 PIN domain-containing protein [Microcoleus sp. PH2017_11_PCY_U_A]MCC3478846.1 PIN domain-containing protein [Microcoleus sp. PH2017_12_PCY_D_A]MCC3528458.1 PIN domain-containing protein [Microcoleus sp. PH2017_21_RUC_O_A]MCC3540634.1 PIN domain-containing protein [Microcoleus sp. PH2017_22_RUC_O_B]